MPSGEIFRQASGPGSQFQRNCGYCRAAGRGPGQTVEEGGGYPYPMLVYSIDDNGEAVRNTVVAHGDATYDTELSAGFAQPEARPRKAYLALSQACNPIENVAAEYVQ